MFAQFFPVADHRDGGENGIVAFATVQDPGHGAGVEAVIDPEQPAGQRRGQGDEHTGHIGDRREPVEPGADQHFRVQHADREHEEHIGADKRENVIQQVYDPEQGRRVLGPGLIQPIGDALKDLCADVDRQDGEERAVQADRKPRPEKIVAHNDYQNEHAGNNKAVVHFCHCPPFPRRGPFM